LVALFFRDFFQTSKTLYFFINFKILRKVKYFPKYIKNSVFHFALICGKYHRFLTKKSVFSMLKSLINSHIFLENKEDF